MFATGRRYLLLLLLAGLRHQKPLPPAWLQKDDNCALTIKYVRLLKLGIDLTCWTRSKKKTTQRRFKTQAKRPPALCRVL